MSSILINGSMCLSDLVAKAQAGHSAFRKGKNGKVYFNFTEWVNEEPDEFKNHSSYLLNSASKEQQATEGKFYFGNGRKSEKGGGEPVTEKETAGMAQALDNLPF